MGAARQQQRRDDAAERKRPVRTVVNQLGPYAEFAGSVYRHFVGRDDEAEDAIKWYLEDKGRYTVSGADEDYNFTLDIAPPGDEFREPDDTLDNWTIGGGITEWTDNGYAATLRIWHFGPVTAQY